MLETVVRKRGTPIIETAGCRRGAEPMVVCVPAPGAFQAIAVGAAALPRLLDIVSSLRPGSGFTSAVRPFQLPRGLVTSRSVLPGVRRGTSLSWTTPLSGAIGSLAGSAGIQHLDERFRQLRGAVDPPVVSCTMRAECGGDDVAVLDDTVARINALRKVLLDGGVLPALQEASLRQDVERRSLCGDGLARCCGVGDQLDQPGH